MSVTNLAEYQDRKVVLTVNDPEAEGGVATVEGKAVNANALGILLKPKGKSSFVLYEVDDIQSVDTAPDKPKGLKAKTLKLVEAGNVRQHLVDRHGYRLSEINAMSDEDALEFHEQLDHSDLGHFHAEKAAADSSSEGSEEESAA